jgi:hypothetical protein
VSRALAVVDGRSDVGTDEALLGYERVVLGWFLTPANAAVAREQLDVITAQQFHFPAHEVIFDAVSRVAGMPDAHLRVLDALIGPNAPRALNALDQTLAVYLAELIKAADCFDVATMRHYAGRLREAHTQRHGKALIGEFAAAFARGDVDAAFLVWSTIGSLLDGGPTALPAGTHRNTDLTPFLDGTYKPLQPSVGGLRDDGRAILYPALWHTCIAPTTSGKSWFALWHCISEIRAGRTVVYAHFEEASPAGTIGRIRQIAPDLSDDQIREHFRWLDCTTRWDLGEFAQALPDDASLVVLDGINAACSQHGQDVEKSHSIGWYRSTFVTPATRKGAAVLSLGHPPKSADRQGERHGYGNTAWLDEVNGAGFRLLPSKQTPIGKGRLGHSTVYTVKDREGEVESHGVADTSDKREGWFRIGSFKVDDRPENSNTSAWLNVAVDNEASEGLPTIEHPTALMIQISRALEASKEPLSQNAVEALITGKAVKKRAALELLLNDGCVARTQKGRSFLYSHVRPFVTPTEEMS